MAVLFGSWYFFMCLSSYICACYMLVFMYIRLGCLGPVLFFCIRKFCFHLGYHTMVFTYIYLTFVWWSKTKPMDVMIDYRYLKVSKTRLCIQFQVAQPLYHPDTLGIQSHLKPILLRIYASVLRKWARIPSVRTPPWNYQFAPENGWLEY